MEVLRRVNPRAVIEYTATPADNSNLIESVSAQDLKDEEMIKLPIVFAAHDSWQQAIAASIQTRAKLEQEANKETDYLRPLVLFQAENKNGEVTVERLKTYLCEEENIPPEHIAIATGEQRELDGLNLFDPDCPVRCIITVKALKEGWNCSFAYVLCALANTRSNTEVEQLLGRVLRMPYAKKRQQPELNQAYAQAFQQQLFAPEELRAGADYPVFTFPEQYPVSSRYDGRKAFKKHYYRQIAAMNGEEAECALVLDQHARVTHWIRNLEKQARSAFWLPTASDKFYPDFVAQLDDGRVLVVEYKGEHLKDSADTLEKTAVGRAWAKASGNVFLMAFKQDDQGRDVATQLRQVLG